MRKRARFTLEVDATAQSGPVCRYCDNLWGVPETGHEICGSCAQVVMSLNRALLARWFRRPPEGTRLTAQQIRRIFGGNIDAVLSAVTTHTFSQADHTASVEVCENAH